MVNFHCREKEANIYLGCYVKKDSRFNHFFFSSRRRHTRWPRDWSSDGALPIFGAAMSSGSGVIVIDGGTACTVDFMSIGGVFHGGAILPGLTVTEHHFKQSLPELPLPQSEIPSQWPGKTTRECIQWGLYGGFRAAIQQFIDLTLNSSHEPLKLFVSGGDAERIANMLGNDHPLIVDQHLL